ncbi:MAG: hypothetical protein JWM36_1158 [Hyphomicrobiales bacterium]|nr:hypothetical protein [Hyphomicrobiales bacterium]
MATPNMMARYVVEHRYPNYDEDVRKLIHDTVRLKKCTDTSDTVIDAIWHAFSTQFEFLKSDASKTPKKVDLTSDGGLTAQGREAIRSYLEAALQAEADLQDGDDDELRKIYEELTKDVDQKEQTRRMERGNERDRWAFFNEPAANAEFDDWLSRPSWTAPEAVALSLGKNPSVVKPDSLNPYNKVIGSPFGEEFARRLDLFERAVRVGDLKEAMTPRQFAEWALKTKITLPDRVFGLAQKKGSSTEGDGSELDARSQNTFYKILLGVLAAKYGLDLKLAGDETLACVFRDMQSDLDTAGFSISDKTIRNHFSAAREWAIRQGHVKPPVKS